MKTLQTRALLKQNLTYLFPCPKLLAACKEKQTSTGEIMSLMTDTTMITLEDHMAGTHDPVPGSWGAGGDLLEESEEVTFKT